ncbi:hypothetical protein PF002_g27489 [Phytophthora fragariae]|nr:hypothetical protein PF003_g1177 [Phytophthora fragariae]KAE8980710.1 hypothetical protein PR002_g24040 [Phytophthora rubi]KAE8922283.1 hypothetical protein PF009_g27451 [Phytophthora fragariae]KAE8972382.1 hypothetical protein PF011_g25659 [Phytophthora fragariae]KAE9070921.1 hypothetical protein PF007_g26752 [Phytophthora fragariae]
MHKLRVIYTTGIIMEYPNPESHTCFSIGKCDNWHPALMVAWFDLPTDRFAMFFEDDNCYSGEGYYMHQSELGDIDGEYGFKKTQPIRSMMMGVKQDATNSQTLGSESIDRGCWGTPLIGRIQIPMVYESAAASANKTTFNTSAEIEWVEDRDSAGGLSANWSDALPEGTGN